MYISLFPTPVLPDRVMRAACLRASGEVVSSFPFLATRLNPRLCLRPSGTCDHLGLWHQAVGLSECLQSSVQTGKPSSQQVFWHSDFFFLRSLCCTSSCISSCSSNSHFLIVILHFLRSLRHAVVFGRRRRRRRRRRQRLAQAAGLLAVLPLRRVLALFPLALLGSVDAQRGARRRRRG